MVPEWMPCAACGGSGRFNVGWMLPKFVDCLCCDGKGVKYPPAIESVAFPKDFAQKVANITAVTESQSKRKELNVFDNLRELITGIENSIGDNWNDIDTEFITPDGKRWRIKQFSAVCGPNSDTDMLECRLQEIKPSVAALAAVPQLTESK